MAVSALEGRPTAAQIDQGLCLLQPRGLADAELKGLTPVGIRPGTSEGSLAACGAASGAQGVALALSDLGEQGERAPRGVRVIGRTGEQRGGSRRSVPASRIRASPGGRAV